VMTNANRDRSRVFAAGIVVAIAAVISGCAQIPPAPPPAAYVPQYNPPASAAPPVTAPAHSVKASWYGAMEPASRDRPRPAANPTTRVAMYPPAPG
jgi:hypothetical protein